jgi:glutaredoxin-related protein
LCTFAPLDAAGEFVGGCDIATQMHQSGELGKLLDEKVKIGAAAAGGAGASA